MCCNVPHVSCVDALCTIVLQLRRVGVRKYSKVGRSAFLLHGKKRIAVLRAGGAITGDNATAPVAVVR